MIERTDPSFLSVARGTAPAELLLRNAQVVDVFNRELSMADVAVFGGRIASLHGTDAAEVIDLNGAVLAPGFIDAHMHVESTMLTPRGFAQLALPRGTTAVVLDPHEIANVMGVPGINMIMDDARGLPLRCWFTASSCVPASPLETAACSLSVEDLTSLLERDEVVALAEMMNVPGVINCDPNVLAKVAAGLTASQVDGHCPGLRGRDLDAYVASGVNSDHESTTAEEAAEKLAAGMTIYIREGTAARNLEALLPIVTPNNAHRVCFCADDRHPSDLHHHGHIDNIIRLAILMGLDPATAIAMGSLHTAQHFGLRDHGAIAPGRRADLVEIHDLSQLTLGRVWAEGCCAHSIGPSPVDWNAAAGTVHLPDQFGPHSFEIPGGEGQIRVIGTLPGQLITEPLIFAAHVCDGQRVSDPSRDLLKIAVIERHGQSGTIGLGFAKGFGFNRGAIASTVGHDAHNLAVVGCDDQSMTTAARALAECGGGLCVALGEQILALLELPIAGLMSNEDPMSLIETEHALYAAAASIGSSFDNPFMPLSFLPLSVIPHLKISNLGLVDVDAFEVVTLDL
ncbi:MAG: adenine deaminase [Phycisphaerae bacterium]|nr:adenine deaminase [Phycisphaerae bacterium]